MIIISYKKKFSCDFFVNYGYKKIIQSTAVSVHSNRVSAWKRHEAKRGARVSFLVIVMDLGWHRSNTDPKWVLSKILAEHVKTGSFASLLYRVLDDPSRSKVGDPEYLFTYN